MASKKDPGGFARRWEIRQTLLLARGCLFTACLPVRYDPVAFARALSMIRVLKSQRLASRSLNVMERMRALLQPFLGDLDYDQLWSMYREILFEDSWGRWREGIRGNWRVQTRVDGLHHLQQALGRGNGAVFWGMSFCGALVPKIALRREGIWYTQLSAADHGCAHPLTWFGRRVAGPTFCKPESRHIRERVRIPVDDNPAYMKLLMRRLAANGCIWISAERMKARQPVRSEFLGREAPFPTGAPALAHRMGAGLFPVYVQWEGRFRYRLVIDEPIEMRGGCDKRKLLRAAVDEFSRRLQKRVLAEPAGWHWESPWVEAVVSMPAQSGSPSTFP